MSGASFPDMEKYMRQHALIWEQLPMQWNEGAFLGNGLVGMMVYADSTLNALVFHLGRPDVTDHRKAPYRKTSIGTEEQIKWWIFAGLNVGKMLLFPEGKILSGTFLSRHLQCRTDRTPKNRQRRLDFPRLYSPTRRSEYRGSFLRSPLPLEGDSREPHALPA